MAEPTAPTAADLREHGLLPDACHAVYLAGSVARGWANDSSDLDFYVIVDELSRPTPHQFTVALEPGYVQVDVRDVDGRRWDLEYWTDHQVDQVLAKVGPDALTGTAAAGHALTAPEKVMLNRLSHALCLTGTDWLRRRTAQLDSSAFRSIMVAQLLNSMDAVTEDAVGQLGAGDLEGAVLSAKLAFGRAIDALLASHGEYGVSSKWRARRFRVARPSLIEFERYWAFETMRDFDPEAPREWVREVLELCQDISLDVRL